MGDGGHEEISGAQIFAGSIEHIEPYCNQWCQCSSLYLNREIGNNLRGNRELKEATEEATQLPTRTFFLALSETWGPELSWAASCHHDQTSKILLSVPQIKSQQGQMGQALHIEVHDSEWLININVSRKMYMNLYTVYIMIYTYDIYIYYVIMLHFFTLERTQQKVARSGSYSSKNLGQAALHLQADCQGLQSTCTMPQPRCTTEGSGWFVVMWCASRCGHKGQHPNINSYVKNYRRVISGWWFQPLLKKMSVGIIIPNIWKNKKCSKPPTRKKTDSTNWLTYTYPG